jgi:hypothetical protein
VAGLLRLRAWSEHQDDIKTTAETFSLWRCAQLTLGIRQVSIPTWHTRPTMKSENFLPSLIGSTPSGILPAGHTAPEEDPSLIRSLLEALQIPETPEEIAAELSAADHVVE